MRFAICVPTLNAGPTLGALSASIKVQTVRPNEVIVVDSGSEDGTVALAQSEGFRTVSIPRSEFRHGGTRQLAAELAGDVEVVVYITQDAILADPETMSRLLRTFDDQRIGAAYGRQLPRKGATPIEAHARFFNYPAQSVVRSLDRFQKPGLRYIFFSNSFGAYRSKVLAEVGGFPQDANFGEDTIVAARILKAGWKIAYSAEAIVNHSHNYSFQQEFRRYIDVGTLHAANPWLLQDFGAASGEGFRYVVSEINYLLKTRPALIPSSMLRTGAKLLGYRYGRLKAKKRRIISGGSLSVDK